jgi:hypothetical protein
MNPEVAVPLGFMMSVIICVVVTLVARYKSKELEARQRATPLTPALDDRLDRLERAIDSIAIEVERLAEGQRFTAKLLSERAPARALSSPESMVRSTESSHA